VDEGDLKFLFVNTHSDGRPAGLCVVKGEVPNVVPEDLLCLVPDDLFVLQCYL
jgi:hypothetical protein